MTLFYPYVSAVIPYGYSYQTTQFGEIVGSIAGLLIGVVVILGLIGEIISGLKQIWSTIRG